MRELSLHVLDLLQNSVEAGASRIGLAIDEDLRSDRMTLEVTDNGRGMGADQLARAADPFFTTRKTRHVGLGLPLLSAAAQHCGGGLEIQSTPGVGTTVRATFQHSHIDRAPLGNIRDTLLAFVLADSTGDPSELSYWHRVGNQEFAFSTAEIRAELDGLPLFHPQVRTWLRDFITEGEAELYKPEAETSETG